MRQTFAKSRPLLPWGNYEDILDLLQEVDYTYTAYDIPTLKGYATERGLLPSVTSDQQSEGVTCECWRNIAVLLETFPCVSDQNLSQNCHFFYDPLHIGAMHHFKMFWRSTHRKDSPQKPRIRHGTRYQGHLDGYGVYSKFSHSSRMGD